MNQLTTLYYYLKQLAEADELVNCVMKTQDIDLKKEVMFPLVNIIITSGGLTNGQTILFNIELGCFNQRDINFRSLYTILNFQFCYRFLFR